MRELSHRVSELDEGAQRWIVDFAGERRAYPGHGALGAAETIWRAFRDHTPSSCASHFVDFMAGRYWRPDCPRAMMSGMNANSASIAR